MTETASFFLDLLILICSIYLFFSHKLTKITSKIHRTLSIILIAFVLETLLMLINVVYLLILWGVIGDIVTHHSSEKSIHVMFFFNLCQHIFFICILVWQCYLVFKSFKALEILEKTQAEGARGQNNMYIISNEGVERRELSSKQFSKQLESERSVKRLERQAWWNGRTLFILL